MSVLFECSLLHQNQARRRGDLRTRQRKACLPIAFKSSMETELFPAMGLLLEYNNDGNDV